MDFFFPWLFYWTSQSAVFPAWWTDSKTSNRNVCVLRQQKRQEIHADFQPTPYIVLVWFFSFFFCNCAMFCNSCSAALAQPVAPVQPKGCFANADSVKPHNPSAMGSRQLLPLLTTSSLKPEASEWPGTDKTHSSFCKLKTWSATTDKILSLSLCCYQPWEYEGGKTKSFTTRAVEFFHLPIYMYDIHNCSTNHSVTV